MAKFLQKLKKLRHVLSDFIDFESIIRNQLIIQKYHEYAYDSSKIEISNTLYQENQQLIVSLTTYNKRISEVYLCIESILHQTVSPTEIVLWLAESEFEYESLPTVLKNQEKRGLSIRFCKDLKSYKKLLPTLIEYTNCDIITIDDDFIYPRDFIENLLNTSKKYPNCVCYYRGARIKIDRKEIQPYIKWAESEKEYTPSLLNFATGAGGVFYPNSCFSPSVSDINQIMSLAPTADDIWFKAMTLINNVKYVKVKSPYLFDYNFISLNNMQDIALYNKNVGQNRNDEQIKSVFMSYNLYPKLISVE